MRTYLTLDVRELLESPGSRQTLAFDEAVPELGNELVGVHGRLRFDLAVESMDEGILVRGPIGGTYTATCRRCLEQSTAGFEVQVAEVYRPASSAWEEGYVISEERIDLEPMVRDNVVLSLPLYPVCRQDCRGLCSQCGTDLNEGSCTCASDAVDLRWEQLRQLLDS